MRNKTRHTHRTIVATRSALVLGGLAFSAGLAAQQLAPLPARLAEALHGQDATTRSSVRTRSSARSPAQAAGGKAPGSIAPAPDSGGPSVYFSANFDDCGQDPPVPAPPPAGTYPSPPQFTVHNVDNRTPAANVAYVSNAWIVREDFQNNVNDCVMFSTSWYAPPGAANDWAAFPTVAAGAITPTANTRLRWNAKTYDPLYRDGYEVRYSTAGTAVADFLANPALFSTPAEESTWTARELDLGTLAGTPIHLAFRNNSNDKFLLVIDDIVVEDVLQFDPELTAIANTEDSATYGVVPAWLGMPYALSATVLNNGENALTGVTVDADTLADATLQDSGSSLPLPSLASGATSDIPVFDGVLDSIGRWTAEGTVTAVEGDQDPSNSSAEAYLVHVSADEISRAVPDEPTAGTLGIGAGNGGELGNDFVIDTAARLIAIRYTIENSDQLPDNPDPAPDGDGIGDFNGLTLQATLRAWNTVDDEPGAALYTVDVEIPADAPIGATPLEFALPPGTILPPGRYLAAAVEPIPPTLPLHTVGGRFTPGTSWIDWPTNPFGGWANPEEFGPAFARHFRLSAVLVPPVFTPVAVDDDFAVDEDNVLSDSVAGNDTPSDDGGNVWSQVTGPAHGVFALAPDGGFTYTPDADFNGSDSFTYALCDVDNDCTQATATIEINAVNDSPTAANDVFSVDEDGTLDDSVATNDTPSGDGGNTWAVTDDVDNGVLTLATDGSFNYVPDADFNGNDTFEYTLCDVDNDCSTATATITVDPVNDVPLAADDSFTVQLGDVLDDSVAGNDTPSPDGANVWTVTVPPASGALLMQQDGSFSFTPSIEGSVSFDYSVCDEDGVGDCAAATATIEVTAAPGPVIFVDSFESNPD